jgi:hypothetical protein
VPTASVVVAVVAVEVLVVVLIPAIPAIPVLLQTPLLQTTFLCRQDAIP